MKTFTVALIVTLSAVPAFAQNKREMQMMADIRMLQEQNQQLQVELQAAIATLSDTLKQINGRVDEQSAATRKAFADQALKLDQFATEQRVVREGVSENNVRISQLSQEVEAVRLSIPQFPPPAPAFDPAADPSGTPGATPGAPPATAPPGPTAVNPGSPQRLFNTAQADYYAAQWDLCVSGFEMYLRTFPKSELAHEAQFYIGECQSSDSKWQDAVAAYNQVISTYPRSASAANAYYKRGLALERLGQSDRARESYETVMKNFPDSDAARLAKQSLDRLNRGRPPE
jgi:tol-pal system protein YbgF